MSYIPHEKLAVNWTPQADAFMLSLPWLAMDLYDPVSFVSYLICYRLEWESVTWSGQDGFGQFLERLLKHDEAQFFQAIGWVSKQSWFVTTEACQGMEPALIHFEKAHDLIHHY